MTQLPDFDTLKWLAEHRPEQLELLQSILSEEAIASSTRNQQQLKCLIFHLHQRLDRCPSAYHRCQTAMDLISEKLSTLSMVINEPKFVNNTQAEILPFTSKRS